MRQLVIVDELPDGADDLLVRDQLLQRRRPVLLHPGQVRGRGGRRGGVFLVGHFRGLCLQGGRGVGTSEGQKRVLGMVRHGVCGIGPWF